MKIRKYVNPSFVDDVVRINYIYAFRKDELLTIKLISKLLLEGTITQEKRTSLKRKLMQNYDADININTSVVSNVLALTFEVRGMDKNLLPGNESVIKNITEILMDCINNTNILLRDIDEDKLKKAKEMILEEREYDKNSILRVIEEAKEININYKEDLEKITVEDLKNVYMKIITTGKIFVQIQGASEEELNKVSDIIKKNICYSSEDEINIKYKKIKDVMSISSESHLDSTRVDFVLERKSQEISVKELILMQVIANMYNDLMFTVVREKYNLSYNPSAIANISENSIILSANVSKENKELAITLMSYIVDLVTNYDFEQEDLEYLTNFLYDSLEVDMNQDLYNETLNVKRLKVEDIENITVEDLKEHAKNYEVKLVHYLGGK